MESLYLLIPLSAALVLVLIGIFGWALHRGQFEDLEREGQRILDDDTPPLDAHQQPPGERAEQSQVPRGQDDIDDRSR